VQVVTAKKTTKWMYIVSLCDVLFMVRVSLGAVSKEIFVYRFRKTICCRLQEDQKEPLKDEYDQVIPTEMWDDTKTALNIAVLFTENVEAHGSLLPCTEQAIEELYWEFTTAKKNTMKKWQKQPVNPCQHQLRCNSAWKHYVFAAVSLILLSP
jgi:hypothetical protein